LTLNSEAMLRRYAHCREMVNGYLQECFSGDNPHGKLVESMRYSLLAGGKRIRPVLVLQFCAACGGDIEKALPAACAIEMLHTYSLIHDDLPCMDDDDMRRGRPSNHIAFGECTATLAGDALQAEAFGLMLRSELPAERVVKMCGYLADAAGIKGICSGQALDMDGETEKLGQTEVELIHRLKTASLLVACAKIGAAAAGGTDAQLAAAERYADALGLAFQVRDDVLDHTAESAQLGKNVGSDAENGKTTFFTLFGAERCNEIVREKTESAVAALSDNFSDPEFLRWFAAFMAERNA